MNLQRGARARSVGRSTVALPGDVTSWPTLLDFFTEKFPHVSREAWRERFECGEIANDGAVVFAQDRPRAHTRLTYFRRVENEPTIPFSSEILYRDERIVVADKPHFLPVVPGGRYVKETLLARMQQITGIDTLVPAHRIDRDTAGVVLFTTDATSRNAYQRLFRERKVEKIYEAVAPVRNDLTFPIDYCSRLERSERFMQATEVEGEANAITRIDLIEASDSWALYRLYPITGARHQLRAQMSALGIAIRNDRIYPVLEPLENDDFQAPLQLIAKSLAFIDPIENVARRFVSRHALLPWS